MLCFPAQSYEDLLLLAVFVVIFISGQCSFLLPIHFYREAIHRKIYIPVDVASPLDFPIPLQLDEKMLQSIRRIHMLSIMTPQLLDNSNQKSHTTVNFYCFQLGIPSYVFFVQTFGVILCIFGWFLALANDDIRDTYKDDGFGAIVSGNYLAISAIIPLGVHSIIM